jgi:hypothetical protein
MIRARCTTLYDKVCSSLPTGRWFSPGHPVSSTNKTDRHDITEILLKVALNIIKQTNKQTNWRKHIRFDDRRMIPVLYVIKYVELELYSVY